jgi:ribosomal protein S18 acetylase RimI-like enzyme
MAMFATDVEISPTRPDSPEARAVLTDYFREVASRIYGREATDAEVEAEIRADPSDHLCPPTGLFLVARAGQTVVGCVAVRLLPGGVGEVMRVFVEPAARSRGLGALLMATVEAEARAHGVTRVRLDTRKELTEARRLYAKLGYHPTAPFNTGWADLWFEKSLA